MEKNHLLLSLVAVGLSFIGGFLLANTLNRGELAKLRAEYERSKNSAPTQANTAELTLSDDEIESHLDFDYFPQALPVCRYEAGTGLDR